MEFEIIVALIILFALVFLAIIDLSFAQLSDVSLRRLAAESEEEQNTRSADFLREILENRAQFRFTLSSSIQILNIIFTVAVTIIILRFVENYTAIVVLSLLISLILSLVFRQILPRLIISNKPEGKLMFLLPVLRPLYALSAVFVNPFSPKTKNKEGQKLENSFTPETSDEKSEDNNDDFQALMEVGEAEGIIEEKERALIETMIEFSATKAGEIMTPRTEICAVPIDSTVKAVRDVIISEKYSRLPVYRDSIDNIEGVIYVRDLLQMWADGRESRTIEKLLRPPLFVPETKSADELLKTMQSEHFQIAIVVDEYGGIAGLVTVEDILEEIVGEIEDEDTGQEEIIEIIEGEDGYFDVLGSTEINRIERLFDLELENEDYTTIAGLVTSECGYVPKPGETLILRGMQAEILKADEKRINLLRLRLAPEDSSAAQKNNLSDGVET